MKVAFALKPQDVLILLKMVVERRESWRLIDLAQELGLSQSEVSMGLERSRVAGLVDSSKKIVVRQALEEFVIHGLRYVFPVEPGPLCRGMPTSHSAKPLAGRIVSNENDQYVWPDAEGALRGQAIEPLYPSVPHASRRDQKLHEMLALIDALRVGRARERAIAVDELRKRIGASPTKV